MNAVRLLALLFASALLFAGCKGQCQSLSEKICDCVSRNNFEREDCYRRTAEENRTFAPTAEQEGVCAELIETCECGALDTPEGKQACGLAR